MNKKLEEIIRRSSFEVVEGAFIYAKVSAYPREDDHFMVLKDNDEITVVTKAENLGKLSLIEKNKEIYALIALHVSIPFYSVGFLAAVSRAIADQGVNILVVSTYSRDYVLIKQAELEKARSALKGLGFREK